jgi:thioredoxin reductase (NADPH)
MSADLIIVGAGPVGLYAAFYAGLRGIKTIILDSLDQPGGQLKTLYPEKFIYDIPGHPKIRAGHLVDNLIEQIEQFEDLIEYKLAERVEDIHKNDERDFVVKTNKGEYQTKAVLVAAGGGAFNPRKMGVDGEDTHKNIHYFVDDMKYFHGKKVAIFGGGDSAVDWGCMLHDVADVTVIHRRNQFRAKESGVEALHKSCAKILTPYSTVELVSDGDDYITHVKLKNNETDEIVDLDVDEIIVNFGFVSSLGPIKNWPLEMEKNKILTDSTGRSSVEGIFAVGNIAAYPGRLNLITVGFGEVPIAINELRLYIDPAAKNVPVFSSNIMGK